MKICFIVLSKTVDCNIFIYIIAFGQEIKLFIFFGNKIVSIRKFYNSNLLKQVFLNLKGQSNEIFELQFFFIIQTSLGHWSMG